LFLLAEQGATQELAVGQLNQQAHPLLLLLLQIVGAIFGSLLVAALVPEAHIGEIQGHTYLCETSNQASAAAHLSGSNVAARWCKRS
jgi:hypothetical protein